MLLCEQDRGDSGQQRQSGQRGVLPPEMFIRNGRVNKVFSRPPVLQVLHGDSWTNKLAKSVDWVYSLSHTDRVTSGGTPIG